MKPGDVVMVYQKPATKEKPEGKAKLIRRTMFNEQYEAWFVEFLDELGTEYFRTIVKE